MGEKETHARNESHDRKTDCEMITGNRNVMASLLDRCTLISKHQLYEDVISELKTEKKNSQQLKEQIFAKV